MHDANCIPKAAHVNIELQLLAGRTGSEQG